MTRSVCFHVHAGASPGSHEGRACTAVLLKAAGPRVSRGVEQRGRAPSRRSFVNGRATRAQESAVPLMFDAMQPFNGEARIVVAACDNLVTTAAEVAELPWSKFVTLMKVLAPRRPAPGPACPEQRAVIAPAAWFPLSPAPAACGGVVAHARPAHAETMSMFDVSGLGYCTTKHAYPEACSFATYSILCEWAACGPRPGLGQRCGPAPQECVYGAAGALAEASKQADGAGAAAQRASDIGRSTALLVAAVAGGNPKHARTAFSLRLDSTQPADPAPPPQAAWARVAQFLGLAPAQTRVRAPGPLPASQLRGTVAATAGPACASAPCLRRHSQPVAVPAQTLCALLSLGGIQGVRNLQAWPLKGRKVAPAGCPFLQS